MSGERFDGVRALMAAAVGPVFPAAQLAVAESGVTVLEEAFGACSAATVFDLASLTKVLVTTTLAMRLIDAGRLSLADEARPGVTLRHLLCHASGLPAWRPYYRMLDGLADPGAAVIAAARAEPLESPPGTRSVYSDLGFLLLGDAIERAGDGPIDDQWRRAALSPATYHPDPASCAPTERDLRGVVHDDNARFMAGGGRCAGHAGLFGTAGDVAAQARQLVAAWQGRPGGVVRGDTVRAFFSPCGVAGSTFCLGWDRPAQVGPSQAGARWPRDGVGHLGFTGCSLWIDPARARWVVLLSNRVHPSRDNDAIRQLRPTVHDAIVTALDGDT